jgi:putative SOS response-associated peptidase YedK
VQADGKTKIPYYIHTNDQEIFAFAGLWDSSKTDAGDYVESVTHITLPANDLVAEIHNTKLRMPAILEKADRDAWLTGTPEEAWETLVPYPNDLMVAYPVSKRVNTPKNNDAQLIEPPEIT